ncbi:MAG: hypothetical protein LLF93_10935 [Bacteroidales bacterium]|nr:hypothetical protein [Bacteroidales bacterium]
MQTNENQNAGRLIYKIGAFATIFVLAGILLDIVIGTITGGDITSLPKTAIERFNQLDQNPLMGLYNMDFLNAINQLIFIPAYFALFAAHKNTSVKWEAKLAFIIFLAGTTLLVTGNTSLTMLDLSNKFASADSESQKMLYAAAGEAMLARGAHGSLSVLIGFLLPNIAGILMSFVMIKGGIFGKKASYAGLIGSFLMVIYLLLVTFAPGVDRMATAFAMPGGILLIIWIISFMISLFRLGK